jgi:hypothetical protein
MFKSGVSYPPKDEMTKEEKNGIFRIDIEVKEGLDLNYFGGTEKVLFVSGRNLHKLMKRIKKVVKSEANLVSFYCEYEGDYTEAWVPESVNSNGGCWDCPEL